jgi:prepilin-type N-terminal cleavage/methylation domain-containing protein
VNAGDPGYLQRGLTLIELVMFLAILGVASVALFRSFGSVVPRTPTPAQLVQGAQLAQERMELILGQRQALGYGAAQLDPCKVGSPAICSNTLGFSVTSVGTGTGASVPPDPPVVWNANPTANFKLVTVTVKLDNTPIAIQNVVVANY